MDNQTIILLLSALSALATAAAAAAAIFGPKAAAKYAVDLQEAREAKDRKFQIFLILMSHRKNYGQAMAAQHLNVIDAVWAGNRSIKNAWASLFESLANGNAFTATQIEERFRKLLVEIANDLGISDNFSADDFARVYYSNAMSWQEQAAMLQNRAILANADQLLRQQAIDAC